MDILSSKSLPQKARNFIETYFSDYYLFKVTFNSSYSAVFKGGSSINFNTKGEWTSIIGNRKIIQISTAEKFIDSKIMNIIKNKYTNINNIYKRSKGYEFKVDNAYYIYIDYDGNILKTKKA